MAQAPAQRPLRQDNAPRRIAGAGNQSGANRTAPRFRRTASWGSPRRLVRSASAADNGVRRGCVRLAPAYQQTSLCAGEIFRPIRTEKTFRIQRDDQLTAVRRRTGAVVVGQRFLAGHIADQRPGQHQPSPPAPSPYVRRRSALRPPTRWRHRWTDCLPYQCPSLQAAGCLRGDAIRFRRAPLRWWPCRIKRRAIRARPAEGDGVGAEQRARTAGRRHPAWLGVQAKATNPCSVSGSMSAHSAEKCTQRLIANAAIPLVRTLSIKAGRAVR